MATLAEINDTLVAQNEILSETNEGVKSTSSNIDKLVKQMAGDRMDALEDKAEERRITKKQSDVTSAKMASDTSSGFSLPSLPFGGIGKLFAAGSLIGLGATLGKTLLTRGIPSLVLASFADEIADYITKGIKDPAERKRLSDTAFGAIKGLSIGMIFGKRFALIGTILGGIISNEEVRKEFDTLGDNLRKELDDLGITVPSFATVLKGITGTITGALRTINSLFGDGKDANGKEIEKDFTAVAATLGGLALLLAPGATFRMLLGSLGGLSSGIASLLGIGAGGKGGLIKAGGAFLFTPAGLASMIALGLYSAIKNDQADGAELANYERRIAEFKKMNPNAPSVVPALTDDEWKQYQNLKSRKDPSSNVPTGGDPRQDPEVGGMLEYEKQINKFRYGNTDVNVLDQGSFDLNKKFTGPAPLYRLTAQQRAAAAGMSRSAAAQLNYTARGALVRPQKATVTKRQPQTAPAVAEAATTATANNIRPVIVQSNNNPISTTTVSSPQAFMAPAGAVFDMSDGFLIGRGFSR